MIEVASGNTVELSSPAGLVVPKYDGTNNGALVFDKTGTAYVGDAVLDSNGLINTTATGTKLVALAGRAKTIARDNLVKWDDTNQIFVDAGIAASDILTNGNFTDYISKTATEPQAIKSSLQLGSDTQNCAFISETGSYKLLKKGVITEYNADNIKYGSNILTLPSKSGTIAVTDDITNALKDYVTIGTQQQITGAKTFTATTEFTNAIKVNGVVGTTGQVLISRGEGQSPAWSTLTIPQGTVKKFVKDFTGNNTNLEFSYEHELGTKQCRVRLHKLNDSNNYEMVMADIILTATNVIIKFAQAPSTTDSFRVVVTG